MLYIIGSRGIPARYGGFETFAEQLHKHLRKRGIQVEVIGTRDAQVQKSILGRMLGFGPLMSLETPLLTWSSRPKVHVGDVVLVLNPVNVWTAKSLKRQGARVLLHMDGMEHLRAKWGPIAKFAHRVARRTAARSGLELVVDSHAIGQTLRQEFGVGSIYIPYGGCEVAESSASHRWKGQASDYYLVIARPEPENHVLEICQAFTKTNTDHLLKVVGAPTKPTGYWRQIEAVARADTRIRLLGSIWDRRELCDLMINTVCYIHGHSVGGTNPILVDVLSHGTPVSVLDNPYNREAAGLMGAFWSAPYDIFRDELLKPRDDYSLISTTTYTWKTVEQKAWVLFDLSKQNQSVVPQTLEDL